MIEEVSGLKMSNKIFILKESSKSRMIFKMLFATITRAAKKSKSKKATSFPCPNQGQVEGW